ncbi:putative FAD-dependent isoamyl alcohol oxidase [Xylogone sp. PMI_703]|nr:putative FAD-dependent isoamyl alcohol oxidase [Xylogone sp. PMI_703]
MVYFPSWCLLSGAIILSSSLVGADHHAPSCRYIPTDVGWPNPHVWAQLNRTVGGRLIATIPQASVCHLQPYSDYDAAECEVLRNGWDMAQTFELKPAEIMNPYFQNQSCDPFTPTLRPCRLGQYASYSINVTGPLDIIAGLKFAQDNNVRLVIKNTGHDYLGKSTGPGALSLWVFNLKTRDIIPEYTSASYSGPAIKLGSGVVGGEAIEAAAASGYRLVGGECGSVGIAGGYTQGGGHSILNSEYGMAADNVLEWEVVTAKGEYLIATPNQHSDLYWALSGGGGGTYAVVLSMTARLYKDGPIVGGILNFTDTNVGNEIFWEAITLWYQYLPFFIEGTNNTIQFVVENNFFTTSPMNLVGQTNGSAAQDLVAPFLADLDRLGIRYSLTAVVSNTYEQHFSAFYGPLPYGPEPPTTILNSRLVPVSVLKDASANSKFVSSLHATVRSGQFLVGCSAMNVTNTVHQNNSVLPAWRDTIAICNVNSYWNWTAPLQQNLAVKNQLVDEFVPLIEAATPGSGVYLNEMDPLYKGDWKYTMYGENYPGLLKVKHRYDPKHIIYGHFTVGSDELFIDQSGRLCKP